jgi:hypothetical protein
VSLGCRVRDGHGQALFFLLTHSHSGRVHVHGECPSPHPNLFLEQGTAMPVAGSFGIECFCFADSLTRRLAHRVLLVSVLVFYVRSHCFSEHGYGAGGWTAAGLCLRPPYRSSEPTG